MITESLINYIKNQRNKNVSEELIVSQLAKVGWHMDDIKEGLDKATPSVEIKTETHRSYTIDPYHEPIDSDSKIEQSPILKNKELELKEEIETKKEEIRKIWTPRAIKPVVDEKIEVQHGQSVVNSVSTRTIESFPKELNSPNESPKIDPIIPPRESIAPVIKEIKPESNENEIIPTLIQKPRMDSITPIPPTNPSTSSVPQSKIPNTSNNLSKMAMISSYSKDYVSASKLKEEVFKRKKSVLLRWLIIILIICILGGAVFIFTEGYFEIPKIKIPFIKKDTKTLLLNSATNFASLKSYKVETGATISFPSFADTTSGLMEGESVPSNNKESFSFSSKGKINKLDPEASFFRYDINFDSSLLESELKTSFKFDEENSIIDIPDLSQILREDTPPLGMISIPNEKINQIKIILPVSLQEKSNNIDFSKLIPSNSVDYISNQFVSAFKDFTGNIEMIKKGEREIHGIDTYNYSVNVDRPTLKKLLTDISGALFVDMSDGSKIDMEEFFRVISIDSFEVWIGKKDGNIYQYKFTLTIPLSKIIGLEDKSMTDSEVTIDWHTTYYDLDVPNNEITSLEIINFEDFMKRFEDIKIKNIVSSFTSSAQIMKDTLGNYGKKSNSTGSCSESTSGSLFSPLGHKKEASAIVETIAETMNTIVTQVNEGSLCYSTSKAWALASPLSSDPNSYFCVDSEGSSVTLIEPLSGTSCQ